MNKQLHVVHIDDDSRDLHTLRECAATLDHLQLLGSFSEPEAAIRFIHEHPVDIVFLDIIMPDGKDGFWIAEQLAQTNTGIIFISSSTDFLLRAFEACALDYIVKPISAKKLEAAVARFRLKKQKLNGYEQIREVREHYIAEASYPRNVFINVVGEIYLIPLEEILYFEASGTYTHVHTKDGRLITSSKTLRIYEESINGHPDFLRIHRSYLINQRYIIKLNRTVGKFAVTMSSGVSLAVSQKKKDEVFDAIMHGKPGRK